MAHERDDKKRKKVKIMTVGSVSRKGGCEYKCPLHDQPAIIVTRLGESRADELLPF